MCDELNIPPEEYHEALRKIKEELDKLDWKKCREEGEKLERQIGIKSLTVEDWFRQFTI